MKVEPVARVRLRDCSTRPGVEPTPERAAPQILIGRGRDVRQVLLDERERSLSGDARQQVARVEAQLEPTGVDQMRQDVLARDGEALVMEVGDRERVGIENLDRAERVESVAGADDQNVLESTTVGKALEGPEGDRKPRLLDRRLERIRLLGQAQPDRPAHAAPAVRSEVSGGVDGADRDLTRELRH